MYAPYTQAAGVHDFHDAEEIFRAFFGDRDPFEDFFAGISKYGRSTPAFLFLARHTHSPDSHGILAHHL